MKKLYTLLLFLFAITCKLFSQIPDTEIWLADLTFNKEKIEIKNPKNITSRQGYDNQPQFTQNDRILFTSIRENDQADIFEYDIKSAKTSQLTFSTESEYSPTPLSNKEFSCVRVEKDSTQRLWKFNGKDFQVILPGIDSVGYHCWIDTSKIFLFILGSPFTLQLADLKTGKAKMIDSNIGRGMVKSKNHFYYVKKDSIPCIVQYDILKEKVVKTISSLKESEDFVILNNSIIMASDAKLFSHTINAEKQEWKEIADLSQYGITKVTRLAIDKSNKKIAIVSNKE